MLPDVLQAGMLEGFEPLLQAVTSTLMLPLGLAIAAYVWMCLRIRHR